MKNISKSFPLMYNNISKNDINILINFLKKNPKLTAGKKCSTFEKLWSKWLGVKYSVFVNSGSSANFITFAAIKSIIKKGDVIVPPLTWPSDIMAVLNNNLNPKFVDINLRNLSMDSNKIIKSLTNKTKVVFIFKRRWDKKK